MNDVVLFGGWNHDATYADTWLYDPTGDSWSETVSQDDSPPARMFHSMAFDSAADRIVMFGGFNGQILNDTWVYDPGGGSWNDPEPSGEVPAARMGHAMAYDAQTDKVLLFGGQNQSSDPTPRDTWAYDLSTNTWTDLAPTDSPTGRRGHCMAYDPNTDKVFLFGGQDSVTGLLNDLWAYDSTNNRWDRLEPVGDPPAARMGACMAYDSSTGNLILFGGQSMDARHYTVVLSDTWIYVVSEDRWTRLAQSADAPPARAWAAMVYDSQDKAVIVYGGLNQPSGQGPMGDLWSLSLRP